VWDEVESKVEAIQFADIALPAYQKYMTSDQAEIMILLYKGPTGRQIASILADRSATAVKAGYGGYANDQQVAKTMQGDSDLQALFAKLIAELSPEQKAQFQRFIPGARAITPKIEDESNAVYNRKANEIIQQVMASHKADIARAQAAAAQSKR
jgi:hypothetical protein